MQRFSFTHHLGGLTDRGTEQFAGDGIAGGLQTGHQRCSAGQECRKGAGELRNLEFEERVTNHGKPKLEAIESGSTFFGAGPDKHAHRRRGQEQNSSENNEAVVDGQGYQQFGGAGQLDVQVAVKQSKLGNYSSDQVSDDDDGHADQQHGIDQRRKNFLANAGAHTLIGDVIVQDT